MASTHGLDDILEQTVRDVDNMTIDGSGTALNKPANAGIQFMKLPGEQRNRCYRLFFDELTSQRDADVWDNKWPSFPFTEYLSLLLVCRQVSKEASSIFEEEYLPTITWHFVEPECLRQFAEMVKRTNLRNVDVQVFITGMTAKWCPVPGIDATEVALPWDLVHQQHVPGKLRDARPAVWREYSVPVQADEVIKKEDYILTGRVMEHYTIRTATVLAPERRLKFHRGTRRLNIDRWCNDAFEALEGYLSDIDWSKYKPEEGRRAQQALKDRNAEVDAAGGTLFDKALEDIKEATAKGIVLTSSFFREKYKNRRF